MPLMNMDDGKKDEKTRVRGDGSVLGSKISFVTFSTSYLENGYGQQLPYE